MFASLTFSYDEFKNYGISKISTMIINRITIIKPNESVDFIKIYAFIWYVWKFETEQSFKKSKKKLKIFFLLFFNKLRKANY